MHKEKKPTENVLSCSAALLLLSVKHNCLTAGTPALSQGRVLLLRCHQNDFLIECLVIHLADFDILLGMAVINLLGTKAFSTASFAYLVFSSSTTQQTNKMMS